MKFGGWTARILGVLIVLVNLFGLIGIISDPVEVRGALVVGSIMSLLWIVFGAFLVYISLKKNGTSISDEEESVRLKRNRNWIFAFILLTSFIASAETWLMNNYLAGFTSTNVLVIFDLVFNVVLLYFVARLLRDKIELPKGFLAVIVIYSLGLGILHLWRGFPLTAIGMLVYIGYFGYAVLAPITRKHFQIAHLVILPVVFALFLGLIALEEKPLMELLEREAVLDEQYGSDVDIVASAYAIYLEKTEPSQDDIRDVQEAIAEWASTTDENMSVIEEIERENERHLPSLAQETNLEYWRQIRSFVQLRRAQFEKMNELMEYVKTVNFNNLSVADSNRINTLEEEIIAIGDQITTAGVELSQSLNQE